MEGLSLGQLAERLGLSKSALFAHWRSKEELQLAAIAHARRQWTDEVVRPALRAPRGVRRLWALHDARLAFYAGGALAGGCFFANAEFEYGGRPSPVRDRLADANAAWLALIERLVGEAVAAGELTSTTDATQLTYEIDAFGVSCVLNTRLMPGSADAIYARARRAVLDRLRAACPDPRLLPDT